MDDRIKSFLDTLKMNLDGLAEEEINEALSYYEEYFSDALDEGASPEELLSRLDPPEKIAAMIEAETSIKLVQTSPGLKNYSRLVKFAHIGITRPLSVLMLSILIFTTYSTAVLLFLCTVIPVAAACMVLAASISEALKIPAMYAGEIAGTVGLGIFASGIFILTACVFYMLYRPLIRLSAGLVYKMMKRGSKPADKTGEERQAGPGASGRKRMRKLFRAGLIITAAGLIISLASGLPAKLFMIFNSMKPADITVIRQEFSIGEAEGINVYTAHSNIRLREGSSEKIVIEYEKSDWLDYSLENSNGGIVFEERSNGRLPLFSLVSLHENCAELTVSLPAGFDPGRLSLESRGGTIWVESGSFPADIKTHTGTIRLAIRTGGASGGIHPAITAKTAKGAIFAGDKAPGVKTRYGTEYELPSESPVIIRLESERGNILLD